MPAVLHLRGDFEIVRDHDQRGIHRPVQVEHQRQHLRRGFLIEIAGRFVGEQAVRPRHQRARQRHALTFAAGKFARFVLGAVGETDLVEPVARLGAGIAERGAPHQQRHRDVFERAELGQ